MTEEYRPVAPVDPTNLRPMLFLDAAREMMLNRDWSHRAVSIVLESHTGPGRFAFYGAKGSGLPPGPHREVPYPSLPEDVPAVDYSGWPIYCRADTPGALVELFCTALITRRDEIVWNIGGPHQPPLPLEQMVRESPVTPLDVPMHPRAAAVWQQHGYLP